MEKFNFLLKSVLGILFTLTLTTNVFPQFGWIQQYSGTANNLNSVSFVDNNTGFILNNPFLKTTNGGVNWVPISGLPAVSWVDWIDANTGYGPGGTIFKTTNGGLNWTNLNQTNFSRISFADGSTGSGFGPPVPNGNGALTGIYRTVNGGINWNLVWQYSTASWLETMGLVDINVVNPQVTYFTFNYENFEWHTRWSRVYSTTGSNWVVSFESDTLMFNGLVFPTVDTGYVIGVSIYSEPTYNLFRRVNNVWSVVLTLNNYITTYHFSNGATGYVVENAHIIHKTTNGGLNWNIQNPGTSINLRSIYFINPQTGYITGDSGLILKTTTGGEEPVTYSVSGQVRYEDNNQPVASGYVKALYYNSQTQQISVVDSAAIGSNGTYMLPHCPSIELDIMAYENDEEDAAFVPTYYVSTIYWENATHLTPDTNLTGIDIGVYRINNNAGNMHIGGTVYRSAEEDLSVLNDAIVYARIGNVFKGYSITGYPGTYCIDSLASGTYEIIANRMGFYIAVRPPRLQTIAWIQLIL